MRNDLFDAKDQILQWIDEERSKAYMCRQLKCKQETLNSYLNKMGIEYTGQQARFGETPSNKLTVEEYLGKKGGIKSNILKYKLIQEGIKEYKCEYCGKTEWNGLPIPLELHHIDGNHYNNDLSNLMIVCPNCHTQLTSAQSSNATSYTYGYYINTVNSNDNDDNADTELQITVTKNERKKTGKCIDCGKPINSSSTRCIECHNKNRSTCPYTREELKQLIRKNNFCQLGLQNQVSDNTVRKWCKKYGLPTRSAEIKQYSDEEWANI